MKCPECGAVDELEEVGVNKGHRIWRCRQCEKACTRGKLRMRPVSPNVQADVEQIRKAGGIDSYLANVRQAAAQSFPDLPADQALDNWNKLYGSWEAPSH